MTPRERGALQRAWATARTRLVLLDYDGTLAPIAERPEQAAPGPALLGMLDTLARCDSTRVVIVSGRTRDTLDAWFQGLEVWLVAEHGAWLRARGGTWGPTMPLRSEWKSEIRPILELFVDRTPGTFIEEKTFSLAWHYRAAAPNLEPRRAGELKQALFHLASSLGLAVLEGRRVIEVKNAGIHKGVAAGLMVSDQAWDFILAAGDDWTDEDLFEALPASAFTIKVGRQPSWARHHIESPEACLRLLEALARAGSATPAAS